MLLGALIGLAACGDDGRHEATSGGAQPDGTGFPVTIDHLYGATEIPATPERIVTIGLTDHDSVLAFDVAPVAISYWYGDGAIWPWAEEALGDHEPVVLGQEEWTGELEFNDEEVLALHPDLILALYADLDEDQYGRLADIAPTVVPPEGYAAYALPWQEAHRMAGAALGRSDEAETHIELVEGLFSDARAANPEFDGVEVVLAERFDSGASYLRAPEEPRTRVLTDLGFTVPEDLADLARDDKTAAISDENMDLLDRDLLVWNVGWAPDMRDEIEAAPLYAGLEAVQDERVLYIEDEIVSGAMTWSTPLSLPFALEHLVPDLQAVVSE